MRHLSITTILIMMSTVLVSADDDADEDRTSRQKVRSSWRYRNFDDKSQWILFCEEFPIDAMCRHESDPTEINVLARSMPIAPSEPEPPAGFPSRIPSTIPISQLPTSSPIEAPSGQPSSEVSESPSLLLSSFPSILPTRVLSQTPSIVESMPPSEADSTQSPSHHPSPFPSMSPSLVLTKTPIPTSAPTESAITAPPKGNYTSFPSQYPSGSPSSFPNGPTLMPSVLSAPPNGNYTFPPSQYPSGSPSNFPNGPTLMPSLLSAPPNGNYTFPPSQYPSGSPSSFPNGPTLMPSVLSAPPKGNYTFFPSQSPSDTQSNSPNGSVSIPSLSPSSKSGSCTPDPNGDFGDKTNTSLMIEYYYEVEYNPSVFDPIPNDVIFRIERKISGALIPVLFQSECATASGREILENIEGQRSLQSSVGIVGLSHQPIDLPIPVTCTKELSVSTNACTLVKGEITLFLVDGSEPSENQAKLTIDEIEASINSGELVASEPGMLQTVFVRGEIINTNAPTQSPANGTATTPARNPQSGPQSPTSIAETTRKRKIPVFLIAIVIGMIPILVLACFFMYSQRKRRRESNEGLEDSSGSGARGRRRLHLMSIPGRDSEHSLSLPLASCSNSRSDSGSFQSLIAQQTPVPQGDEELKLRPSATGSLM